MEGWTIHCALLLYSLKEWKGKEEKRACEAPDDLCSCVENCSKQKWVRIVIKSEMTLECHFLCRIPLPYQVHLVVELSAMIS